MNVCVYGASSSRIEPEYFSEAERLGRLLAENGFGLVFGGGREGLMGAVSRGAFSKGGRIIGIAPRFFDEPGILCENCSELIFTETMNERKALMAQYSDAFIALPGGIGTFEELFETLTLKQLGRTDKAIVLLNTLDYYAPIQSLLFKTAESGFMS